MAIKRQDFLIASTAAGLICAFLAGLGAVRFVNDRNTTRAIGQIDRICNALVDGSRTDALKEIPAAARGREEFSNQLPNLHRIVGCIDRGISRDMISAGPGQCPHMGRFARIVFKTTEEGDLVFTYSCKKAIPMADLIYVELESISFDLGV